MDRASSALTWLVPFGLLVVAMVSVPLHLLDARGLPRYRALKAELAEVDARNADLARDNAALERTIEALRTDPASVEHIARDQLGMVRPGELVVQF